MSNKSMKLFFLRYGKGGDFVIDESTGEPAYFYNKKIAKLHRKDNMVVTYGSDHKKFKGGLIYASKKRNNKNYEGS